MQVDFLASRRIHNFSIKSLERVDIRLVAHCYPQNTKEMSQDVRGSTVGANIHLDYVIALSKREKEHREQEHEVNDFVDDSDDHCDQEVQLLENAEQVKYFYQRKHDAEAPKNAKLLRY